MPAGMAQAAGVSIRAVGSAWAVELANGDQCTLHGTLIMAGQTVHYGCADGGMILGETITAKRGR